MSDEGLPRSRAAAPLAILRGIYRVLAGWHNRLRGASDHGRTSNLSRDRTPGTPPVVLLVVSGIFLIAIIVASTWILVSHLLDRAIAVAERESSNITMVLAEHTDQAFQVMELAQISVIERMRALGVDSRDKFEGALSTHDTHLMLKDKIAGLPHVDGIAIFDAGGKLVNFSRSWPVPSFDVTQRDYFTAMQADANLQSFVGLPLRNRGTGTWAIAFALRVSAPNNEMLGFVVGVVELQYFEKLFAAIKLESGSSMALFRRDGTLLARHPRVDSLIGHSFGTNALSVRLVREAGYGVGRMAGVIDGEDRIIAAHAVRHYPPRVSVVPGSSSPSRVQPALV